MTLLYLHNLTGSTVVVADLGIEIPGSAVYQIIPERNLDDVQGSSDLRTEVLIGHILLSKNGSNLLSLQDSIDVLTEVSQQDIDEADTRVTLDDILLNQEATILTNNEGNILVKS